MTSSLWITRLRKASTILCICLMLSLSVSIPYSTAAAEVNDKEGPLLDGIQYNLDQLQYQVLALQDDEIDIIGISITPEFLSTLRESEDISIDSTLTNGYGYITINCAKYPFNITAFRKALAVALDKEGISRDVWDNQSVPLDSSVPMGNPFSAEGQLVSSYYDSNLTEAMSILDDAGFIDIDADPYREAPDGSDFDVIIRTAPSDTYSVETIEYIADTLVGIGINATAPGPCFYEHLSKVYFHGDYDMVLFETEFEDYDIQWLANEYWSQNFNRSYYNFPNFQNATIDTLRETVLYSSDYDEVLNSAIEIQRIIAEESPIIVLYQKMKWIAYRTDRFEGFVNDSSARGLGWWTYYKAHLKEGLGGTLRVGIFSVPDSFNIIRAVLAGSENILSNFYESLLKKEPQGTDINWLIDSYTRETSEDNPAIPAGHERFTIDLVSGLNWSDGTSLTAYDVVFSLETIEINSTAESPFYAPYVLNNVTSIEAINSQQFVIEFNCESYWHLSDFGYIPIFPSHIFGSYNASEMMEYDPIPPDDTLTTSGPFIIDQLTPTEQLTILRRENYHFLPDETTTETSTTSTVSTTATEPDNNLLTGTAIALGGGIGVIVLVMVIVKMKRSS